MMITDPFVVGLMNPSKVLQYGVEVFFTVGVIVGARVFTKMKIARQRRSTEPASTDEAGQRVKE